MSLDGTSRISQTFSCLGSTSTVPTFVLVFLLATPLVLLLPGRVSESTLSSVSEFKNGDVRPGIGVETSFKKECTNWQTPPEAETDAWVYTKKALRPAPCKVRGFVVEALDPAYNFRHPFSVALTADVEDKSFVAHYFLAYQDLSLQESSRRVFLDLGGNHFDTSTGFFLKNYPLDFTEVHTFEKEKDLFIIPPNPPVEDSALHPLDNGSRRREQEAPFPSWILSRIKAYNVFVSDKDVEGVSINITRFIKDVLKIMPNDALIIKMDIEGAEWDILPGWLSDLQMLSLIDELFIEIHYSHPTMGNFGWLGFKHTREEANELLEAFRNHEVVIHPWP